MLDNLKFRKLDNGYTIKYHIAMPAADDKPTIRFGGEKFVKNKDELVEVVTNLINELLEKQ